jgi:hypothetical protein
MVRLLLAGTLTWPILSFAVAHVSPDGAVAQTARTSLASSLTPSAVVLLPYVQQGGPGSGTLSTLPPAPAALPPNLFIGLGNADNDLSWLTGSGVPFQARYVFLSGGVNTGHGWSTWNTPSGAYATLYMNNSASVGEIPVFTYDQILASNPHLGSGEAQQDMSNLANPATMLAYYTDWKLLMTLAGAFGKPVIVHLEPDFMGYLELNNGTNATVIPAAVASSGMPEAASYPNNAAGFAQTLLHLRNLYAPNVLVAFNVSPWASGQDVSTTSQALDVPTLAQQVATFYLSLGANFDLLFYQVSSRDAAYFQYVVGDGGAHWWDMTNTNVPDFSRFAQWTSAITTDTGKRGVLWHVPLGNNIYDTENNTSGHYQDNKIVYWLGPNRVANLTQFANAGIVGIMFGAGDQNSTHNTDFQNDGITNPPAIDGNISVSSYSDDDGGYLRLNAQAYYTNGVVPLP